MKVNNLLVSGFTLCMLSIIPQPMEAQFFKKIGNMLEAVDKALGGDTSKTIQQQKMPRLIPLK